MSLFGTDTRVCHVGLSIVWTGIVPFVGVVEKIFCFLTGSRAFFALPSDTVSSPWAVVRRSWRAFFKAIEVVSVPASVPGLVPPL